MQHYCLDCSKLHKFCNNYCGLKCNNIVEEWQYNNDCCTAGYNLSTFCQQYFLVNVWRLLVKLLLQLFCMYLWKKINRTPFCQWNKQFSKLTCWSNFLFTYKFLRYLQISAHSSDYTYTLMLNAPPCMELMQPIAESHDFFARSMCMHMHAR
jgi:hypothetical protein